jgi:hypothetical protein
MIEKNLTKNLPPPQQQRQQQRSFEKISSDK